MPAQKLGSRVAAAVVVLAAALLASFAGAARADTPRCTFALASRLLTGPAGADLTVRVTTTTPDCRVPARLDRVEVRQADEEKVRRSDLAAPGGVATFHVGDVPRGETVALRVKFHAGDQSEGYDLRGTTTALLRPDLVVTVSSAPRQVLDGRSFDVGVRVAERNGDVGATARLTLTAGAAQVGAETVDLGPGATATRSFVVHTNGAGDLDVDAAVSGADPGETTTANNDDHALVEVTQFEVAPSQVVVPSLVGYGSHFNHRVYAKISRDVGVTAENVLGMESKMIALQPQFVRIFVNNADLIDPDRKAAFVKTVLLAQRAGATINVTWQGGTLDVKTGTIPRLAAVLNDLVLTQRATNLRWLTLQNEPNSTALSLPDYEARYRQLDPFIFGIRGQVRFMGGDLVLTNQRAWFDYMATHMADILDAWSVHIFWDYWDTQKLQDRLSGVRDIWDQEPAQGRKPLYVTEYGVRGIRTFNGVAQVDPGVWEDGTPITQTNVNAFQHAWFDILSSRLGYVGTVKWDSYFAKYDAGTQAYFMVGPPQEGWPAYPVYHDVQLWTSTVKPGWKVIGLDGSSGTKLVTAYASPTGDLSVIGLDTSGAQLNAASPTTVGYSIGGLPPLTTFHVVLWNGHGDGQDSVAGDVVADPAGVATVSIPLNAVFSLTTVAVPAF